MIQNRETTIIHHHLYSALLVADDDNENSTTISSEMNEQQKEDDMEDLQLLKDFQHKFEQRRRTHGSIIITDSDSDENNSDSDVHSLSTDPDSEFLFDVESISSNDEDPSKKKIHIHHVGPVQLYLKERFGKWPKYHYKKFKRENMKKQGIEINYGNIHTKEIKCSLKSEKHQRQTEANAPIHLSNMMGDLPKLTTLLSLDLQPSDPSVRMDKTPIPMIKTKERKRSKSKLHEMKDKFTNSFKRKDKETIVQQQTTTNRTSDDETDHNSNHFDKF
jgi:hypothetical protein